MPESLQEMYVGLDLLQFSENHRVTAPTVRTACGIIPFKFTGWTLVWGDEFNGPNGSPVDRSKWVPETGGDGRGNHELEY